MRKRIISLLSMVGMAFIVFMVFGLMINWNLFLVIICFVPILIIGLGIIVLPKQLTKIHKDLENKIDQKISDCGEKIHNATKV